MLVDSCCKYSKKILHNQQIHRLLIKFKGVSRAQSFIFAYLLHHRLYDMTNSLAKRLTFRIMAVVFVMMAVVTGFVYVIQTTKIQADSVRISLIELAKMQFAKDSLLQGER